MKSKDPGRVSFVLLAAVCIGMLPTSLSALTVLSTDSAVTAANSGPGDFTLTDQGPGTRDGIYSYAFNAGADSDMLVVSISTEASGEAWSVSYDGVEMTLATQSSAGSGTSIFYLANPSATGSIAIDFTAKGTVNGIGLGIASLDGEGQAIVFDNGVSDSGVDTIDITPNFADSFVMFAGDANSTAGGLPTLSSNLTEIYRGPQDIGSNTGASDVTINLSSLPDAGNDVTVSGPDLTILPAADFAAGTHYAIQISADAVEDASGNAFAGILDTTTWNFATVAADATAPVISTRDPADDATDISIFNNIVATFDEDLVLGSGNITIYNVTLGSPAATIDVTDATQVTHAGNVLTINPAAALDVSTEYAVQMDAGVVRNLNDLPNAAITDTTTWSFTTQAVATYTWN